MRSIRFFQTCISMQVSRLCLELSSTQEFQPDGWDKKAFKDFNEGKPDVVFMVYDPNNTEVPSATAGRLYEDYDEAVEAQDEAVSDYKFPVKFKTEDKIYKPLEKQNAKEQAGPRYSLRPTEPSVRPSGGVEEEFFKKRTHRT
jgi:hypothetical protein